MTVQLDQYETEDIREERRTGSSTYRPRRFPNKLRQRGRRRSPEHKAGIHERGNNRWAW